MAHEQLVVHHAAGLGVLEIGQLLLGAAQVRAAVLEHARTEGNALAIRRELVAVQVHRKGGELLRDAAGQRLRVQLLGAGLAAEEVHLLAIRRQRRAVDVPAFRCEPLGRRQIAGAQIAHPQAGGGLAIGGLGLALGEYHHAAIGRKRGRGHAVQRHHVAHIETARGGQHGQGSQQAQGQYGSTKLHGSSGNGKTSMVGVAAAHAQRLALAPACIAAWASPRAWNCARQRSDQKPQARAVEHVWLSRVAAWRHGSCSHQADGSGQARLTRARCVG